MGLCFEVCLRFDELIVGAFQMTYVVPDHPPCLVKSDLDVRVLHLSSYNEKQNSVTIIVTEFCLSYDKCNTRASKSDFNKHGRWSRQHKSLGMPQL
ncbi:hypothetical protein D8674_019421 [Pyrus ussuriensis x Pyrus communis]|uniref:Uncharacterized protein n=1 Tax=Pyrus ussuriensis x Pyrus communis TaxID=2448454 RepID=A0A5N5G7J3_9ROSA|nr:hypothetical protein D8674_019421 [Pyrus ussuriensis x Pyrus communis]